MNYGFRKIFIDTTGNVSLQMFRYALVCLIVFGIDAGLLYVFTEFLHIYYLISTVLSSLVAGVVNYFLSANIVFNQAKLDNKLLEFVCFTLVGAGGLLINVSVLWFFTVVAGWYYMVSKSLSVVLAFLWTFFGRKYFLFTTKSE